MLRKEDKGVLYLKYCKNCGSKIDSDASFCPFCGQKLTNIEKSISPEKAHQSDPSLTKNIVLVTICVLLILLSTILGNIGGAIGLGNCAFWLFVGAILAFFAIRPSADHIDTDKMNLLKTIESFGISVVYLVFSFFISSFIGFLYQVFVFGFALMTVLKVKKIDIMSRNTTEKILLAFSIVLIIFSSIAFLGFFIYIFA